MKNNIFTQELINKFHFFGLESSILKKIISLGWPAIVGMMTQTAINTIDLIMVGRLPENLAVPGSAAIMSSVILLWGFGGFLSSISVGTQTICARRFSQKQFKKTGQVLLNSIVVSIIASIIITGFSLSQLTKLFTFLAANNTEQEMGIAFSRIRLLGLFSMALMASYKSFYDGIGKVKVHMIIAIIMFFINILFDYLLIFGFSLGKLTIKPMNIIGAAWGSVISSYSGLLLIIIWTHLNKDKNKYKIYKMKNLNIRIAKSIAKLSFWSGIATVALMTGFAFFKYIVSMVDQQSGSLSLNSSASSLITHVMMLIFMSAFAFGISTATLVSQSIGAGKNKLAAKYCYQSTFFGVFFMGTLGLIIVLFPEPVLRIFLPNDLKQADNLKDAVISLAIPSMKITAGLLSPFATAGLILTQALYGAGQTKYIMFVELILHFFCLVPLAWLLAIIFKLGLIGCWLAAIIYAFLLTCATAYKFIKREWMHNNL